MRLSINFIFILITCAVLRLDLVGAERVERAAKNRQVSDKGLEGQTRRNPQGGNKIIPKYKNDFSEEESEESDEEPRKKYKIKQQGKPEKRNKNLGSGSEEEGELKKGRWNINFKNHKRTHSEKDAKAKFTTSFESGRKNMPNRDKHEDSDDEEEENEKPVKGKDNTKLKKNSVDKEGAKKYLKSKNEKNSKESKKVVKKSQEDDKDSSEESGTKNKQLQDDLKPFAKVRKSNVVRKQRPKKIEAKIDEDNEDDSDSEDTNESKNGSDDDDSTDTEESNDEGDKDSLQCDSLEENCDL